MAFRETVKSMRAYLLVAGVIGGFNDVDILKNADGDALVLAFGGIGLVVALGFVYCGVRLPTLLARNPGVVQNVLYGTLAMTAASAGILALAEIGQTGPWVSVVVGGAIALYLLANVKRLAAEVQAKPDPEVFS